MKKIVISGMIGNGLEWYDYALYGQMALILSKLFFPPGDEYVQLLATFGVFAAGFVIRPLGAIFFGFIGDKYGRRTALAFAILMMAIPTGCIAILPTYAQIGLWAPAALTVIRLLQGLSLGGEFSGSITYIVEHAPPHRRGLAGSASLVSLVVGFLLGSLTAFSVSHALPVEDFESWGWRIPFALGIVVGLVGFYIRSHCSESPDYEEARREGTLSPRPVRDALTQHPGAMAQCFGVYMLVTMPFYLVSIYFTTFTVKSLGRTLEESLMVNALAMGVWLFTIPLSAWVSDRVGRKKVMVLSAFVSVATIYPLFLLLHQPSLGAIVAAQMLIALPLGFYMGPVPVFLVEMFPTRVRFTGMAIAYNLCAALFGGTAPMVCEWLIKNTGSAVAIAWYMAACGVCALVALAFYRETAPARKAGMRA